MKEYFAFPKASALLETHHQIHTSGQSLEESYTLQRCSQYILQSKLTGLEGFGGIWWYNLVQLLMGAAHSNLFCSHDSSIGLF